MTSTNPSQQANVEEGRQLAHRLYRYELNELEKLPEDERERLRADFPQLSAAQFEDVLHQVITAKRQQQAQFGWQSIPHDLAAIVLVVTTSLVDLRAGLIAGVGVLVFLESLFMAFFDQRLYGPLSLSVWLTYPAYALLAYVLYGRGYAILEIAGAVLFAWVGLFLLGGLARVPLYLLRKERAEQRQASKD